MASPSSDAPTTVRDKVYAPHNHENSCLMRQDESTVLGISIDERGNGALIPQITLGQTTLGQTTLGQTTLGQTTLGQTTLGPQFLLQGKILQTWALRN